MTDMTPEIARWLRDEVLPVLTYNGPPGELRKILERHDEAVVELTEIVDSVTGAGDGAPSSPLQQV